MINRDREMRIEEFNTLVVGAGLAGAVAARKLAEESERKVLVVEKKDTVAGTAYDYYDAEKILVHKYGPHIFHTSNEEVYAYLRRFGELEPYELKELSRIDGKFLPYPFNFAAVDALYDSEKASVLKKRLQKEYKEKKQIMVLDMLHSEDNMIHEFAEMLFEKDYRPYTMKQWNLTTEQVGASILGRCKFYLSYYDKTNSDKYEFVPQKGYTTLITQMLSHPRIRVETNLNSEDYLRVQESNLFWGNEMLKADVIYTGSVDGLFKYVYGELPYRSLRFEFKSLPVESYQPTPITVYPQEKFLTRITEYTKLPVQKVGNKTCICLEYPVTYQKEQEKTESLQPYYPIVTEQNMLLYDKYLQLVRKARRLYLCGRLAEYRYYDMDAVVESAFRVCRQLMGTIISSTC